MKETFILGVYVHERITDAQQIQSVLTKFGCSIRTRLGLHEASEDQCSPAGLIILELTGDRNEFVKLEKELSSIDGVEVQKMVFTQA